MRYEWGTTLEVVSGNQPVLGKKVYFLYLISLEWVWTFLCQQVSLLLRPGDRNSAQTVSSWGIKMPGDRGSLLSINQSLGLFSTGPVGAAIGWGSDTWPLVLQRQNIWKSAFFHIFPNRNKLLCSAFVQVASEAIFDETYCRLASMIQGRPGSGLDQPYC